MTFALWALAAASAAYWGLKVGGASAPVLAPLPPPRAVVAGDPAAIARLLGSAPSLVSGGAAAAAPALASRFQLVGVAAGARSGRGAAVISVDGKPARPYRVGSPVEEGLLLQSVRGRRAALGTSMTTPPVLTLELPSLRQDLQPAATAAPR